MYATGQRANMYESIDEINDVLTEVKAIGEGEEAR